MATILILDDDAAIRTYLATVLQGAGFRLLEASEGNAALEQVRAERPDLVITDILMPGMDGFEFVRRLRGDPAVTGTPVIFITGVFRGEETWALARECGVRFLISKPFLATDILQTIGEALRSTAPAVPASLPESFASEHLGLLRNTILEKMKELHAKEEKLHESGQHLRRLSRRLLEVQERERRHLARQLHDEIGHALTGLQYILEAGPDLSVAEAQARFRDARAATAGLLARVRELAFELRPALLDHLGLLPALLRLIERYTTQTRIQVQLRHAGLDSRFAPQVETTAYRLVQEGLTNVARHAGVAEVFIRLWVQEGMLTLQIEDEGAGFNPDAVLTQGATLGLVGMWERVQLLGGQLGINSAPGEGTQLLALLPLNPRGEG